MTRWLFHIPGEPVAKGRPRSSVRGGRVHTYTPARTANWEQMAKLELRAEWGGNTPLDCPVEVEIVAVFPRPKAMQWKRRPTPMVPKANGPDADNVAKAVLDAMQGAGVIADDRQVVRLVVEKWTAGGGGDDLPGVDVMLCERNGAR